MKGQEVKELKDLTDPDPEHRIFHDSNLWKSSQTLLHMLFS
jgi:hypothetical protein